MAVPTLLAVTPNTGPFMGGTLVRVTGTDFRLPVPVSPPNGPTPPPEPSFLVTFGSVSAPWSQTSLFSTTYGAVVLPSQLSATAELVVDVTIQNLDASGAPIPGETATLPAAFTYRRPNLSHGNKSDLTRLTEHLLMLLASQVTANVASSTHPDYDADTSTAAVDRASLPALVLLGPDADFYAWDQQVEDYATDEYPELGPLALQAPVRSQVLRWTVVGIADLQVEALNLRSAFAAWLDRTTRVTFTNGAGNAITLELDYAPAGDISQAQSGAQNEEALNSGVFSWEARVEVRGFQEGRLAGEPYDGLVGATAVVDDVVLQDPTQMTDNSTRAPRSPGP